MILSCAWEQLLRQIKLRVDSLLLLLAAGQRDKMFNKIVRGVLKCLYLSLMTNGIVILLKIWQRQSPIHRDINEKKVNLFHNKSIDVFLSYPPKT